MAGARLLSAATATAKLTIRASQRPFRYWLAHGRSIPLTLRPGRRGRARRCELGRLVLGSM